jgi:hypothetical protein
VPARLQLSTLQIGNGSQWKFANIVGLKADVGGAIG